jgi:hypothetical protein
MTKAERPTFIDKHGLWSDEQRRFAAEVARRVETDKLNFVRLAWGDTHGYSRAKTLTVPAFLSALSRSIDIPCLALGAGRRLDPRRRVLQ